MELGALIRVDGDQDLLGQAVFLQGVAKAQDGALVGQAVIPAPQSGEVAEQRHVMQGFFHGRVGEGEPLLHEVNAQHDGSGKGRTSVGAPGGVVAN